MNPPEFQRNLYLTHRLDSVTRACIAEWDAGLRASRRLPRTRWQRRRDLFVTAAATSASTRIEGNQLSLWDADQLLTGMRVEGRDRDQREVRNYAAALDLAADLRSREPFEWHGIALQQLNATIMRGLEHDTRGAFRTGPVTVGGGVYSPPNAAVVPSLVAVLLDWVRRTDAHPLVRVALLHLNLVAIHPWFDGNGRTTRVACLLDLSAVAPSPGWANIEPVLAEHQHTYFRLIRDAVGMSWDPENHVVTEWVAWYVGLHLDTLREAIAVDEAERRDVIVILAALESRGEDPAWGPVILAAAHGPFTIGPARELLGLSASAAREQLSQLVDAGWLDAGGRTRGRRYLAARRVSELDLESPGLARAAARAPFEGPVGE